MPIGFIGFDDAGAAHLVLDDQLQLGLGVEAVRRRPVRHDVAGVDELGRRRARDARSNQARTSTRRGSSSAGRSTSMRLSDATARRRDDPHREVLRGAAVRVAERAARAVDLVLAREPAHLLRGFREPEHARRADRVRRQHAARAVHRQVALHRGRAALGHLPTVADFGEPEVLHPHRLVPAERHVASRRRRSPCADS